MPVSAQRLLDYIPSTLDNHMRNKPFDMVEIDRPWLKRLMKTKKLFAGGKQYITERQRVRYDSNFQHYYGADTVTYNNRNTLAQTQWPWSSFHDGYQVDEDLLAANGIAMNDEGTSKMSGAEKIMLANLMDELNDSLLLGAKEKFDFSLLQDGTQDTDAVAGLDALVSFTPAVGTVGGIDTSLAANAYWRNRAQSGIAAAAFVEAAEVHYLQLSRNGGERPTDIHAGTYAVEQFRSAAKLELSRNIQLDTANRGTDMDPSITGLFFHGIPITWNPVFADLDAALSPVIPWENRFYMLNMNHIHYRPMIGHNMINRKPPRNASQYVHFAAITNKYGLTMSKRNVHAALAFA